MYLKKFMKATAFTAVIISTILAGGALRAAAAFNEKVFSDGIQE